MVFLHVLWLAIISEENLFDELVGMHGGGMMKRKAMVV